MVQYAVKHLHNPTIIETVTLILCGVIHRRFLWGNGVGGRRGEGGEGRAEQIEGGEGRGAEQIEGGEGKGIAVGASRKWKGYFT